MFHQIGGVDGSQPNHFDEPESGGGNHSYYDEGRWDRYPVFCQDDRTYRQALLDELGFLARLVIITPGKAQELWPNRRTLTYKTA